MGLLDRLLGRFKTLSSTESEIRHANVPDGAIQPSFAIIDVETTGLSPRTNRVVELAIVRVGSRGQIVDEWASRFNPEGPVGATHIHGITQADVDGAPLFRDRVGTIASLIAGMPIAAHNAKFDLQFMRHEFDRAGWDLPRVPAFCTLDGSRHHLPNLDRRRLADCCGAANVRLDNAHSALGDARATAGLLEAYLGGLGGVTADTALSDLSRQARAVIWPSTAVRPPSAHSTLEKEAAPSRGRNAPPFKVRPAREVQTPLIEQLTSLSLAEVMEEGAPVGALAYLELLLGALEDAEISEEESAALGELIALHELSPDAVVATHGALLLALAHRAVDDGHVSHGERAELDTMATVLSVPNKKILDIIKSADLARVERMGAGLKALPDSWSLGEPLRVGDRVVFTGCDDRQRDRLEKRAEKLGVRVLGGMSRLTAMLVTDGSFSGTKAAKATELGTRVVHPDQFEVLLKHLQPALVIASASKPDGQLRLANRTPSTGTSAPAASASPSAIRTWAAANGYQVNVRGRLPLEVVEAYEASTLTS